MKALHKDGAACSISISIIRPAGLHSVSTAPSTSAHLAGPGVSLGPTWRGFLPDLRTPSCLALSGLLCVSYMPAPNFPNQGPHSLWTKMNFRIKPARFRILALQLRISLTLDWFLNISDPQFLHLLNRMVVSLSQGCFEN